MTRAAQGPPEGGVPSPGPAREGLRGGRPVRPTAGIARLARLGFADTERAATALSTELLAPVRDFPEATDTLGLAADPDLALLSLGRLAQAAASHDETRGLVGAYVVDSRFRERLVCVLGVSEALGEHLIRHPEQWRALSGHDGRYVRPSRDELRRDLLVHVGANPDDPEPVAATDGPIPARQLLRVAYRRHLLPLVAADMAGEISFDVVAGQLSDLADAVLESCLAIGRSELSEGAAPCRLAVIAMGKCGGRELNYVSDVDVIFVAEPPPEADGDPQAEAAALQTASVLARAMMRAANDATAEGCIWEVDAALRPEGRAGALVRTLASHVGYYERWAQPWEFQALLKARPAAGDPELGRRYVHAVIPFVWAAAEQPRFVENVQAMRQRVEEHIPAREAGRELKLGRGGLRDVEFSVQLLQLVHGRSDVMLRSPNTLDALESLATWGYVGRDDASGLAASYRFLRTLEHRLQLRRMQRTHVVPDDPDQLRCLGRAMGLRPDSETRLLEAWRAHTREVRRLHEKIFYRPLLNAVARLAPGEARLTREAARERLTALGFADPEGALNHLEALTSGVSRRAAIQRTLLPVMLGWFAEAPDPDAGLLAFRRMSDALGGTPWYLRLLRDQAAITERLAHILATSRFASDLLLRAPDAVASLGDEEFTPRTMAELADEATAMARRHREAEHAVSAVRGLRRRELFRTAAADLRGEVDIDVVGTCVSDVMAATLTGAFEAAELAARTGHGGEPPTRIALIGMGRLGGLEAGYASDADVMFVHEPVPGADEVVAARAAADIANEMTRLLAVPSPDPALLIDTDLRPEGRNGPLVRTLASYQAYYRRWSSPWEAQALLRARVIAGDAGLGERFLNLIDPLRYPERGLSDDELRETRRLKARMESERLPRGADPGLNLKLGRGGLSDVEWVVQLLQLRHAAHVPGLRTTRTISALRAAADCGLVAESDIGPLSSAWQLASRIRNAIMLVTGRPADQIPTEPRLLSGVAYVLGYRQSSPARLIDDYLRTTRRARSVTERLFYGWES